MLSTASLRDLCLMGYGSNNKNPTEVGAYLKRAAGWTSSIEAVTPGVPGAVTAGTNDFYIHHKNGTEYFIIKNRQKTGRDASLPDHGLTIWHVNELGSNNNEHMTPAMRYDCSLIQADNRFDLESRTNFGDATICLPHQVQRRSPTPQRQTLSGRAGQNSGLRISQISASGPNMTFQTGDAPPNNGIAAIYDLLLS